MRTPEQIFNFIINHLNDKDTCIQELETQLELRRLEAIIRSDCELDGRTEEQLNLYIDKPNRAVSNRQSSSTFDTT
jgi:hypothetical protein